uniref:Uncharacterized protein n=1 Tax=Anguilla anguilla TaxID=7936 RepID=A0A0E9R7H1_ANGAN
MDDETLWWQITHLMRTHAPLGLVRTKLCAHCVFL